jgi:hypothetical protein
MLLLTHNKESIVFTKNFVHLIFQKNVKYLLIITVTPFNNFHIYYRIITVNYCIT